MFIEPHLERGQLPLYSFKLTQNDDHVMLVLLFCCLLFSSRTAAQNEIPIGSWRMHLSYNNIQHIEVSAAQIFAASSSGILVYNRADQFLTTYNKLDGLGSSGISSLNYNGTNDQLLIGYESGDIDIISGNTVVNFRRLRDADIPAAKKINHISSFGSSAFLSTAYGVVVFDLRQLEINETWRDLGPSGEHLAVYASASLNDSIFLATESGVLAGNRNDNLLDFNNWTRFDIGDASGPVRAITTFNNKVYAAGRMGLYRFDGSGWLQEPIAETSAIQSLTRSEKNLFLIFDSSIWSHNTTGAFLQITAEGVTAPAVVKQDEDGSLWIGDQVSGLISNTGGTFSAYLPDGPSLPTAQRMVYANGKLFMLAGGFSVAGEPLHMPGHLNYFENGSWTTTYLPASDLTDLSALGDKTFVSSFGSGIVVTDAAGSVTSYDETNSPLTHANAGQSRITAMAQSTDGLWVANYGGIQPLHLLQPDGKWESFSFNFPNEQHPTALSLDGSGNVWMSLDPLSGGGLIVFDRANNEARLRSTAEGEGALPDQNVHSIATDRDSYIWVGTDAGIAYFFSATESAIKPIFENRFLLQDERVTALAVDAGNRKWIGTQQGVWLFSPAGETLVHHFTSENSPLLSNQILDIEINHAKGEVFFATARGIVSYRSDATEAGPEFQKVRIFPNPVSPGYSGTVGISGLASDAFIRITDIGGRLVWQTQANGGTATWNVSDHSGRRVATGVYLVFATAQDGSESVVGKVAVIE